MAVPPQGRDSATLALDLLAAAVGGMVAPALIYVALSSIVGPANLRRGWAIPCATDIAFSYLAVVAVFSRTHPALPFLLLLAIADDAMGLIVLAVFYPSGDVSVLLLAALLIPAVVLAWLLRKAGVASFWAYLAGPGVLSWAGLLAGGLHPALALVPIVPFMPHEHSDITTFGRRKVVRLATLQQFEHWWKVPVQIVLFFFGLVNAGVMLSSVGAGTWIVLVSLLAGKPIGILSFTYFSVKAGLRAPGGLTYMHTAVVGVAAAIATIEKMEDGRVHDHIFQLGGYFARQLQGILDRAGIRGRVAHFGSVVVPYFLDGPVETYTDLLDNDSELDVRFRREMIDRGFFLLPMALKRNHISAAHTQEDVDRTLDAAEAVLKRLAA